MSMRVRWESWDESNKKGMKGGGGGGGGVERTKRLPANPMIFEKLCSPI